MPSENGSSQTAQGVCRITFIVGIQAHIEIRSSVLGGTRGLPTVEEQFPRCDAGLLRMSIRITPASDDGVRIDIARDSAGSEERYQSGPCLDRRADRFGEGSSGQQPTQGSAHASDARVNHADDSTRDQPR